MRNSTKWFKLMSLVASSSVMMAWACSWKGAGQAFTAGFFGLLGVEALAAPQILLGLGQFLPYYTAQ